MAQREGKLSRKIMDALRAEGWAMIDTELAWAAGFFDGEGSCFRLRAKNNLRLTVSQTDPEPLLRFRAAVGLGNVHGPYSFAKRPRAKPHWQYSVNGEDKVRFVAQLLWPYLCKPKKRQIKGAIDGPA